MKKKSLLLYIPSIEGGGVEKILYLVANYLVKKKINTNILTAFNYENKYFNNKIKIISLKKKT